MKIKNGGDEPPWRELGRIQGFVEQGPHRSRIEVLAVEEALSAVALEVADHGPRSLRRRFRSLVLNRSSKYRQRAAIEQEIASAVRAETGGQPETNSSEADAVGTPDESGGREAPREQGALVRYARQLARRAANETDDPALACARREEIKRIRAALAPEDWALLWQKLGLDRPYQELAAARGVPVGTLKARVARLRMQLRADKASMTLAV